MKGNRKHSRLNTTFDENRRYLKKGKAKIDLFSGYGFLYCKKCGRIMPRDVELNCKVCGTPLP